MQLKFHHEFPYKFLLRKVNKDTQGGAKGCALQLKKASEIYQ